MIVESMSFDELKRELAIDDRWVMERAYGLNEKYRKALSNKNIRNDKVLGISTYTTKYGNNKVYVFSVKRYTDANYKYAALALVSLYEYNCNGAKWYMYPLYDNNSILHFGSLNSVVLFSAHSVARMAERSGDSIFSTITKVIEKQSSAMCFVKYDYNGADDEWITTLGDGVAFAKDHKWGNVVTTYVPQSYEYAQQLELDYISKVDCQQIAECRDKLEDAAHRALKSTNISRTFMKKQYNY